MSTASIIIIGDEILSNKFVDENTPYLLTKCAELNLQVQSVQIIPDTLERISTVVKEESERSTYVFTTGGVGPTHDDMTFEGVGRAFETPLHQHPELVELLKKYGKSITPATLRMAEIPINSELLPTSRGFPQIKVHNVFIFPGVPSLLKSKFEAIQHLLIGRQRFHSKVYLNASETDIAKELTDIQHQNPTVGLGSYPRFHEEPSLILTVEGFDETEVNSVHLILTNTFSAFIYKKS